MKSNMLKLISILEKNKLKLIVNHAVFGSLDQQNENKPTDSSGTCSDNLDLIFSLSMLITIIIYLPKLLWRYYLFVVFNIHKIFSITTIYTTVFHRCQNLTKTCCQTTKFGDSRMTIFTARSITICKILMLCQFWLRYLLARKFRENLNHCQNLSAFHTHRSSQFHNKHYEQIQLQSQENKLNSIHFSLVPLLLV